ncbi:hypothetical protein GON01_12480 [Sphingomonas sp. MAH-20]|uniref:RiboL-PSP-HEPN domain-containing protein n=1 Tax=Sphingomonas horti TaxID=2682842 RepID=A0A6I4J339_9SPHN|nr:MULTISPECIES: MAE_28990/MAE_18760 family HEPN-like nuclease [Sphingomonas]MBA2918715.1 hypothetical protein [Sphingomonas sp. CGMCC 1.13658]MVO78746.1 hypothetical protein [Sphingomonas horti]
MAKPSTPAEFSTLVIENFNWRLRELSALKLAVSQATGTDRDALIRALVVMCYAHWEGHAKFCADRYLEYLTRRRLRFSEISSRFYEVRFVRELAAASDLDYSRRTELVRKILSSKEDRFSNFSKELVNTRSNLNSMVLQELCLVCDLDYTDFEAESDFIDRILLRRRNEIAHGENVFLEAVDPVDLVNRTTALMRLFRDKLDATVSLEGYKTLA